MKEAELRLKATSEAAKAKTEGVKTVLAAAQMTSNLEIARTKLHSEEAKNHRAHHIAQQQVDAAKSKPTSGGHHGKN
jgi:ribonuclease HI